MSSNHYLPKDLQQFDQRAQHHQLLFRRKEHQLIQVVYLLYQKYLMLMWNYFIQLFNLQTMSHFPHQMLLQEYFQIQMLSDHRLYQQSNLVQISLRFRLNYFQKVQLLLVIIQQANQIQLVLFNYFIQKVLLSILKIEKILSSYISCCSK